MQQATRRVARSMAEARCSRPICARWQAGFEAVRSARTWSGPAQLRRRSLAPSRARPLGGSVDQSQVDEDGCRHSASDFHVGVRPAACRPPILGRECRRRVESPAGQRPCRGAIGTEPRRQPLLEQRAGPHRGRGLRKQKWPLASTGWKHRLGRGDELLLEGRELALARELRNATPNSAQQHTSGGQAGGAGDPARTAKPWWAAENRLAKLAAKTHCTDIRERRQRALLSFQVGLAEGKRAGSNEG